MNVFFPFMRPNNQFLEEIEPYFKGKLIFDDYKNFHKHQNIDVINIHWPEKIFNWEELTKKELDNFIKVFNKWKTTHKIVYTRHNIYPHYNKTENLVRLYDFVANNVDAVIHFGNYSIAEFKNRYPEFIGKHGFIEHPLYLQKQNFRSKKEVRELLNIPEESKVVLVVGYIRSNEERKLVLNSFKKVKDKNKLLIIAKDIKYEAPNWLYSYKFKKLYERIKNSFYRKENGFDVLEKAYIQEEDLTNYMNASDVLFIPRVNLLNSGNYYLGMTFNKVIVAPNVGNISEKIENSDNFSFNPQKKESVVNAIQNAISFNEKIKNLEEGMKTMTPELIAQQTLDFFNQIK